MAPIYPENSDTVLESRRNVDFTVNYWLYKGLQKEKLILGVALYGHNYQLNNQTLTEQSKGYYELCNLIQLRGWNISTNKEQMVSYLFNETSWIGAEDIESIQLKAKYSIDNQLGGLAFWVAF